VLKPSQNAMQGRQATLRCVNKLTARATIGQMMFNASVRRSKHIRSF
jgi:hypothetical protein